MSYLIILIFLVICLIITIFLIRESYSTEKSIKLSLIIGVISSIITILTSLLSNKYIKNSNIDEYIIGHDNNMVITNITPEANANIEQITQSFITFDNISSYIISKNFDDTIINNSETKLTFYNHPENLTELNTLTFSFMLDQKYSLFSTYIYVIDNIPTNSEHFTSIQIFTDNNLIYSSENLYSSSLPLQINLDLKDISILSFSINTNMIDVDEEVTRTITFSETNVQ